MIYLFVTGFLKSEEGKSTVMVWVNERDSCVVMFTSYWWKASYTWDGHLPALVRSIKTIDKGVYWRRRFGEEQTSVGATKAKRVVEGHIDLPSLSPLCHIVEITTIAAVSRIVEVECWWDYALLRRRNQTRIIPTKIAHDDLSQFKRTFWKKERKKGCCWLVKGCNSLLCLLCGLPERWIYFQQPLQRPGDGPEHLWQKNVSHNT